MNVATITMDPAEAREKLRAVRARLHRAADEEYKALEVGYEALAKGTPLIHLGDSIRMAGLLPEGRPRFAIARADQRRVDFAWNTWAGQRSAEFVTKTTIGRRPRGVQAQGRRFNIDFTNVPGVPTTWMQSARALVPMVPPDVREHDPAALTKRFVLWEVEKWELIPPRDPMLLRHVGGDLYAVTGAWELTELERAVMSGRVNG